MKDGHYPERLTWLLEQNRLGFYLFTVTSRADVDSLMDEDARAPLSEEKPRG